MEMEMEMEMANIGDDGRIRTGTLWTATSHTINAIVGTGVLTLPWSVAQLGWIMGPAVLIVFACISYYTAVLLCDCYRSPDPINGRRNYTYMDAIRAFLGERDVLLCGIVQYLSLWGTLVGYTVTASMSIMAVMLSTCFHNKGHDAIASCEASGLLYAIIFGTIEVVLSQLPNLEKISAISYIASTMSFGYSLIGLYLCVTEFFSHREVRGTLLGVETGSKNISPSTKVWHSFQALGNIAFAYTYAMLLIEIQDTLRSPPHENKTMKRVNVLSIGATTLFYMSLGCIGYAAFGNDAPGNILTGFHEPFWLIDIANIAVFVHLVGAYQVFAQPIFAFYEQWLARKWPNSGFFHRTYAIPIWSTRSFRFTLCKLVLRSAFVVFTTVVALMLPFFNAIVGLLGSLGFWPLTVYFPVSMYIAQAKIKRGRRKWMALQILCGVCLVVTIAATVGSIADIVQHLRDAQFFKIEL